MLSRSRLRLHTWFALAILVMAALAPAVSAALAHARGDIRWQVCSASGASRGMSSSPELDMLTQGHCALCQLQAQDHTGLPPVSDEGTPLRADLAHAMPERFYSAPATAHAWRAAPARAPPLNG